MKQLIASVFCTIFIVAAMACRQKPAAPATIESDPAGLTRISDQVANMDLIDGSDKDLTLRLMVSDPETGERVSVASTPIAADGVFTFDLPESLETKFLRPLEPEDPLCRIVYDSTFLMAGFEFIIFSGEEEVGYVANYRETPIDDPAFPLVLSIGGGVVFANEAKKIDDTYTEIYDEEEGEEYRYDYDLKKGWNIIYHTQGSITKDDGTTMTVVHSTTTPPDVLPGFSVVY